MLFDEEDGAEPEIGIDMDETIKLNGTTVNSLTPPAAPLPTTTVPRTTSLDGDRLLPPLNCKDEPDFPGV